MHFSCRLGSFEPNRSSDFEFLIRTYNTEEFSFYQKPIEFISKYYFIFLFYAFENNSYFQQYLTVIAVYMPIVWFVLRQKHNFLFQIFALLGMYLLFDIGHTLQFCRTYFALNLIIFFVTNRRLRLVISCIATSVHQALGVIYLFVYGLSRPVLLLLISPLASLIIYINDPNFFVELFSHAKHSFWVFRPNEDMQYIINLYSKRFSICILFSIIFALVVQSMTALIVVMGMLFLYVFAYFNVMPEVILRCAFYYCEIYLFLNFYFIQER